VLALLEKSERSGDLARLADDLPLFSAARPKGAPRARESAVEKALAEAHPDALTPREALELLYKLKALLPREQK
jgi:DNA mismatch repair protein MutS